jgi:hypothetical protein
MLGGYIAGTLLLETNMLGGYHKPTGSGINVSFLGFSVCSQDIEKKSGYHLENIPQLSCELYTS